MKVAQFSFAKFIVRLPFALFLYVVITWLAPERVARTPFFGWVVMIAVLGLAFWRSQRIVDIDRPEQEGPGFLGILIRLLVFGWLSLVMLYFIIGKGVPDVGHGHAKDLPFARVDYSLTRNRSILQGTSYYGYVRGQPQLAWCQSALQVSTTTAVPTHQCSAQALSDWAAVRCADHNVPAEQQCLACLDKTMDTPKYLITLKRDCSQAVIYESYSGQNPFPMIVRESGASKR